MRRIDSACPPSTRCTCGRGRRARQAHSGTGTRTCRVTRSRASSIDGAGADSSRAGAVCADHPVVPSWAAGQPRLISSLVSRASAALLAIGGVALLFAADDILPRIIPGFPEAGAWVGQLLAAPWLGVAALNWLNRSLVIGGIYGRPVVLANMALYFVSAMVLVQAARRPDSSAVVGW